MGLVINKTKARQDLIEKKVTRVRTHPWNEWAYLKLGYDKEGRLMPWAELWDVMSPGEEKILTMQGFTDDTLWEEWQMPDDYEKRSKEIYYTVPPSQRMEEPVTIKTSIQIPLWPLYSSYRVIPKVSWETVVDKKTLLQAELEKTVKELTTKIESITL